MDFEVAHPISVRQSLISLNIFVPTNSSSRTIHHHLKKYIASRVVPLEKNLALQPIGVGQVHRIISTVRDNVTKAVRNLQICRRQVARREAAVHLMHEIFARNEKEAVILVDAKNTLIP